MSGSSRRAARSASKNFKGGRISYIETESSSSGSETDDEDSPSVTKTSRRKERTRVASPKRKKRRIKKDVSSGDSDSEDEEETPNEDEDNDVIDSSDSEKVVKAKVRKTEKRKKGSKRKAKTKKERNKGRRKIKKILDDKDLQEQTREAERKERERLQRLKERKMSEGDEEENDLEGSPEKKPQGPTVVLQKHPHIEVSPYLAQRLRPHQIDGVQFIWNNLVESSERAETEPGGGCILAHCMGLGKTLQTITCVHTFLKCEHLNFKRVLVVAPLNTVHNWIAEFVQWCEDGDELNLYNFAEPKTNKARISMLKLWKKNGGVLILGYDMYRIMTTRIKYKMWKNTVHETLVDPGPDIIVCDEGHMLKNSEAHISKKISQIKTRRRLVLTGTPLQNNLIEYHCMVDFVKPGLLGSSKEFRNRFVNPIVNGQHIDSTDQDVKLMKKRSHVLHQMLEGFVQRKDYSALKPYLSSKFEYVLKIRLTPLQIKLYRHYLNTMTNRGENTGVVNTYGKGASLFADYQNLMRVWTHPKSLLLHTVKREKIRARQAENNFIEGLDEDEDEASESDNWETSGSSSEEDSWGEKKKKQESEDKNDESAGASKDVKPDKNVDDSGDDSEDAVTRRKSKPNGKRKAVIKGSSSENDDEQEDESSESDSGEDSDDEDEAVEKTPQRRTRSAVARKERYRLRCEKSSSDDESPSLVFKDDPEASTAPEWYSEILPKDKDALGDFQNSLKITLLFQILRLAEERKEKVLVFSQSLISLDLIEEMLDFAPPPSHVEEDAENSDESNSQGPRRRWFKNIDYFRMDGATQGHHRQRWINAFNDEDDTRSRLFLISTRAGSLGVNLVGANRVVIFDASWNPSHDTQSMFRVYRFGQKKKCYIYRFIAEGTMEEKIYQRQVNKQSLAFRVVDEQQINRHFTASSLAEMYTFEPTTPDASKKEPTSIVPKDEVLAEILLDPTTRHMIASYHEHDSLLDHQVDEELTEEERKAAWEEYETAKARGYEASKFTQNVRPQPTNFNLKNFNFNLGTNMTTGNRLEDTANLLAKLSKMVANAFYQYQVCEVKPVNVIINHLKDTPLYSNSNEETIKAIATEVNYRLELQRNEKFITFQRLQRQFKELQTQYFALVAGGKLSGSSAVPTIKLNQSNPPMGIPSKSDLLKQLASASSSGVVFPVGDNLFNGNASAPKQTTTTTISEVIEIDEGTSDMVDE